MAKEDVAFGRADGLVGWRGGNESDERGGGGEIWLQSGGRKLPPQWRQAD